MGDEHNGKFLPTRLEKPSKKIAREGNQSRKSGYETFNESIFKFLISF